MGTVRKEVETDKGVAADGAVERISAKEKNMEERKEEEEFRRTERRFPFRRKEEERSSAAIPVSPHGKAQYPTPDPAQLGSAVTRA